MKKVCVSFKEIYKQNGSWLKYGGYIDFYDDGVNDFYDLLTNAPDSRAGSRLVACDGEECEIIDRGNDRYVLKNCNNEREFWLTDEEYDIGVFEETEQ